MAHHEMGASSLVRRVGCYGSLRAEMGLPDRETEAAAEGTLIHSWIEQGRPGPDATEEQAEYVQRCLEYQERIRGVQHWRAEERVEIVLDGERIWTTVDAWCPVEHRRIAVIDWKLGYQEVPPEVGIRQVGFGAALLRLLHPIYRDADVYLYNPRLGQDLRASLSRDELIGVIDWWRSLRDTCRAPDAARTPGPHCQYCRALGTERCPESSEHLVAVARIEPTQLPLGKLADALAARQLVEAWSTAVAAAAHRVWDSGGHIPGWKRISQAGARTIPDPQGAYQAVSEWFSPDEFVACCSCKISPLEEAFVQKWVAQEEGRTKTAAKQALSEILGQNVKRSQGGWRILKDTKKR